MVQPKTIIFKQVPSSVLAKPLNSTKAASVHPSINGMQESSSTLAALLKLKEAETFRQDANLIWLGLLSIE